MSKARELANLGNAYSDGGISGSNLVINGSMIVAQRGTSATVSNNSNEGYSTVDRFYLNFNAGVAGGIDFSQSTDAPDGFANSVKLQCSTTNTTYTTTMNVALQQRIEAQNLQQLAYGTSGAKSITLSWYMKAVTFADPISVNLYTLDGTPEYFTKSFTPTSSWARYTLTFPPSTSATIDNNNGQGFILQFVVAGSSSGTYAAVSDSTAWSTSRSDYRDDIGNLLASTSNELYFTGVQLEIGDTATPFEHRSYADQLQACERYYQQWSSDGAQPYFSTGRNHSSTTSIFTLNYRTEMRGRPSLSISAAADIKVYDGNDRTCTGVTLNGNALNTCGFNVNGLSSGVGNNYAAMVYFISLSGYFALDAEL